jgi:hypothetical protein
LRQLLKGQWQEKIVNGQFFSDPFGCRIVWNWCKPHRHSAPARFFGEQVSEI